MCYEKKTDRQTDRQAEADRQLGMSPQICKIRPQEIFSNTSKYENFENLTDQKSNCLFVKLTEKKSVIL